MQVEVRVRVVEASVVLAAVADRFVRLLSGLRILTAVGCGVFRVPYRVFLPAMSLGSLTYIVFHTALGYFVGPAILGVFDALRLSLELVGSGGPVLLLLAALIQVRRGLTHPPPHRAVPIGQRVRIGLLAALLAARSTWW